VTLSLWRQVFTSDFHAGRTVAAMDWAFGLAPKPGLCFGVSVSLDVRVGEQLMQPFDTWPRKASVLATMCATLKLAAPLSSSVDRW